MDAGAAIRMLVGDMNHDGVAPARLDPRSRVSVVEDGSAIEGIAVRSDIGFSDGEPVLAFDASRPLGLIVAVDVESRSRGRVGEPAGAVFGGGALCPALHGSVVAFERRALSVVLSVAWGSPVKWIIGNWHRGRRHKLYLEMRYRLPKREGTLRCIRLVQCLQSRDMQETGNKDPEAFPELHLGLCVGLAQDMKRVKMIRLGTSANKYLRSQSQSPTSASR
jgi:hypothetical protein